MQCAPPRESPARIPDPEEFPPPSRVSARPGLALWSTSGRHSWVCAAVWPLRTATPSSGTVQIPSKPRVSRWRFGCPVGIALTLPPSRAPVSPGPDHSREERSRGGRVAATFPPRTWPSEPRVPHFTPSTGSALPCLPSGRSSHFWARHACCAIPISNWDSPPWVSLP